MTWTQVGAIQLSRDWQHTDPIAEGSYFRLKHTEAPNGGLFAIAQCELDADGKLSIGDSQILAVEKGISDVIKLSKGAYTNRRIAVKKITSQPSLEQEIRRLFLPNFLIPPNQEINFVKRNNWRIDIDVSDYLEVSGVNYSSEFESIISKLTTIEGKLDNSGSSSGNAAAKALTYVSDGDTNGVFYCLGTNKGTQPWANPHTSGAIVLSYSSFSNNFSGVETIVDRVDSDFCTLGNPDFYQWVKVDLKTNILKPSFYSIKRWQYGTGESPKSWKLQASNDNSTWLDLDSHSTGIGSNGWTSKPVTSSTGYRYFRILQTAINYSNNNYLTLGEWELYGSLT